MGFRYAWEYYYCVDILCEWVRVCVYGCVRCMCGIAMYIVNAIQYNTLLITPSYKSQRKNDYIHISYFDNI